MDFKMERRRWQADYLIWVVFYRLRRVYLRTEWIGNLGCLSLIDQEAQACAVPRSSFWHALWPLIARGLQNQPVPEVSRDDCQSLNRAGSGTVHVQNCHEMLFLVGIVRRVVDLLDESA
jgi:hypothetical protein